MFELLVIPGGLLISVLISVLCMVVRDRRTDREIDEAARYQTQLRRDALIRNSRMPIDEKEEF